MMLSNKKLKILLVSAIVLIVLAIVKIIDAQSKLKQFQEEELVPLSKLEDIQQNLNRFEELSKIDENYILNNDLSKAINEYEMFIEANPDFKKAASLRLSKLKKELTVQGKDEDIDLKNQITNYRKLTDSLSLSSDSINNYYSNKVTLLTRRNDSLTSLIRDNNSLLNRKETVRIVSFKDDKNLLVHFLGEVKNNMANGNGVGIWENGTIYRGEWKNNLRHGNGELTWKDGAKYVGDYDSGVRTGNGTFHYKTGEKYVGEFKNGLRDGDGILYDRDNNVSYKGAWKNDKPNQ